MSTFEDAMKFINFVIGCFVSSPNPCGNSYALRTRSIRFPNEGGERGSARYYLRSITIYPIKSCAGFRVDSWPLSNTGLLHDREWLLKSLSGEILTQKKVPEMCFISTSVDLSLGKLFVESPRCKVKLQIKLKSDSGVGRDEIDMHAQRYGVQGYDHEVDSWFSKAVGQPCTLLRCGGSEDSFYLNNGRTVGMCRDTETRLNFVNEAQFLLVSEESISELNSRLSSNVQGDRHGPPIQVSPMKFRPNLVIYGGEPYAEDGWRSLQIGNKYFRSLGGCNRCQMINMSPQGEQVQRLKEPLATLASYRRVKGKIFFGILLRYENFNKGGQDSDTWLQVGEQVYPNPDSL